MSELLIINTGGTFNKRYDYITGNLVVPKDNLAVEKLLELSNIKNIEIIGTIYKDSLEMLDSDREEILKIIQNKNISKIIIIHGTDTIDLTAKYLAEKIQTKQIVLLGAMNPISINPVDGAINFGVALSYLQISNNSEIMIAMSGLISNYKNIYKNRALGKFEII